MFKFFCVVSIIASIGIGIATITNLNNLPVLISCIFSAIVFGCLSGMENRVISLEKELAHVKKHTNTPDLPKITTDIYSGNK